MKSLIDIAKQAIKIHLTRGEILPLPDNLPDYIKNRKAGVFVTLKNNKELRGCIGTYLPTKNSIAEETIYNAISAATCDNRLSPITPEELDGLSYEVSILSKPEPINTIQKLNPKKYGVIVKTTDGKCGLLLPDLEGVDTIDHQLWIACQKGNIDPRQDQLAIYRFTVEKISD